MPVIPALWEAEAGELLEPGRQRLQWAKMTPLHSSLGDRVRLRFKKKKKKEEEEEMRGCAGQWQRPWAGALRVSSVKDRWSHRLPTTHFTGMLGGWRTWCILKCSEVLKQKTCHGNGMLLHKLNPEVYQEIAELNHSQSQSNFFCLRNLIEQPTKLWCNFLSYQLFLPSKF